MSFKKKLVIYVGIAIVIFVVIYSFYYLQTPTSTFTIKIESDTNWSGTIWADESSKKISGSGDRVFETTGTFNIAIIYKMTDHGYLKVTLLQDGGIIESSSTTNPYGDIVVSSY